MFAQVLSSRSIRLDLHANSITFRRERPRERVAAKQRRAAGGGLQTHNEVLTRQGRGKLLTVSALQPKRENIRGLAINRTHHQRLKSWRSRMPRRGRRQPRVSRFHPAFLTLQQRFKRLAPSGRKRFD